LSSAFLHLCFFCYGFLNPKYQRTALSVLCISWVSFLVYGSRTIPLFLNPAPWLGESVLLGFFFFLIPLWIMGSVTYFAGSSLRSILHPSFLFESTKTSDPP
jgi:hypothetical protein